MRWHLFYCHKGKSFAAVLVFLCGLQWAAADCQPAPAGMVSWWPGDGSANDIVFANNGSLQGGATAAAAGLVGQAFSFDGTNGFVQIPDTPSLRPTNLTVECWVRFNSLDSAGSGAPAGVQYIVFKQNTRSSSFEGFDLGKTRVGSSNVFRFIVSSAAGQSVSLQSSTLVNTGAWYHVAGVRGSNFVQLYVNGVLERQSNVSFPQDYGNFPLYFGTSGQPSWDRKLKGNLDEVSLYNRALSSNEIAAVFAASAAGKCKAPIITSQPQSLAVLVGSNVTFNVSVTGFGILSYEWRSNNIAIAGETGTSLTLSNVRLAASADYTVVVANSLGSATSAVATLTVLSPPGITGQPSNQYVVLTRTATFSVTATGGEPLNYQWRFNGIPLSDDARLSGTITPTLTIQNVQSNDIGGYAVLVSNAWGSVTSSIATLDLATVRYVNVSNSSPLAPYTNWATAATVIQDAINIAGIGDEILVTNGVYQSGDVWPGGTFAPSRIFLNKPLSVVGVNGPEVTRILGNDATGFAYSGYGRRCAALTNGATLAGFTLSAGRVDFHDTNANDQKGGGVLCASLSAIVSNCIIKGNFSGHYGGGAYSGTLLNCVLDDNQAVNLFIGGIGEGGGAYASDLRNCIVTNNRANHFGGGACYGSLTNCLIVGNSAKLGGGASFATVVNCTVSKNTVSDDGLAGSPAGGGLNQGSALNSIVVQNSGPNGLLNFDSAAMSYCCTFPDPGGTGNITNDPVFVDFSGGNFRLATNSPCANAGLNAAIAQNVDLDARPRVVDGVVDMGAYEYQHVPFILTSPLSQSVIMFSNVSFTILAVGEEPLTYQWQRDGVTLTNGSRITGASSSSLTISNLLAGDAGGYRVLVTNALGTLTSAVATLTLLGPPSISVQPVSRTVPAATNVSFTVAASGLGTLSYQWRFNQSGLLGKTSTFLSLTNVQSPNAGDYDVVVSNIYGAVTSSVATLTVLPTAPAITTQAVSRVVSVGQNVSFTVAAKGSEPMTCQWQWNGTDLPGANTFTLMLNNVNASFTGTYRAAVSNLAGFAFSTNVTLVVSPIVIWGQTNLQQLLVNTALPPTATNIVAIAAGSSEGGLPCMVLRADGTIVTWGVDSRDTEPPTNAVDVVGISSGGAPTTAANNLAVLSNGTVLHWVGLTRPLQHPDISNSNIVAVAAGGSHQLALRDDGTVIAWGSNSSGQTNVPPSATNVVAIAAGTLHSLALRADGKVIGWGWNTSGQATALSNAVNVVAIAAGGNQSMGLLADGSVVGRIVTNNTASALIYGPPPSDATNLIAIAAGTSHSLGLRSDRTVAGWGQTNFGQITMPAIATNVLAIAAGANDSLALVADSFAPPIPPRIGRPPLGRALKTGQNAVLNALAIGGLPLSYQWYRNGSQLVSRTNQWLFLTNVHPSDAGDYQLVAMNDFGSTTSAVATVSIGIPQPVLNFPSRDSNGFSFSFDSVSGVFYVSEFNNGLDSGAWTELEHRLGSGGTESVTDTNANVTDTLRYYRVRALFPPPP